jgi:hypothetical protein
VWSEFVSVITVARPFDMLAVRLEGIMECSGLRLQGVGRYLAGYDRPVFLRHLASNLGDGGLHLFSHQVLQHLYGLLELIGVGGLGTRCKDQADKLFRFVLLNRIGYAE